MSLSAAEQQAPLHLQRPAPLSPLPWRSDQVGGVIYAADDMVVGLVRYSLDWQHAMRACNAHDELVDTLAAVREFWVGGDCPPELMARIDVALGKCGAL